MEIIGATGVHTGTVEVEEHRLKLKVDSCHGDYHHYISRRARRWV